MSQRRFDPLEGRWVVIAPDRARRPRFVPADRVLPTDPGSCPFCPGAESSTRATLDALPDAAHWRVRAFPNWYPLLETEAQPDRESDGLHDRREGLGAHEVVVETRDHDRDLDALTGEELEDVVEIWRRRVADLYQDRRLRQAIVFRNRGALAGASVAHAHSQLAALPEVPERLRRRLRNAREHHRRTDHCLLCELLARTIHDADRCVARFGDVLVYAPWASQHRFELSIAPVSHRARFLALDSSGRRDLAAALGDAMHRLRVALGDPPTHLFLHLEPNVGAFDWPQGHFDTLERDFHWQLSVVPRLAPVAGFEWASEWGVNSTPPEDAAAQLRAVEGRQG